MKSKYFILFICIILFSGCDKGLKYNEIEIVKYPSKTVYHVGIDNEIDLSGGEIKLTTVDWTQSVFGMDEVSNGHSEFIVKHSVDFNVVGSYSIELCRTSELCVYVTIQVVK